MAKLKQTNQDNKLKTTDEIADEEKEKAIANGFPDPYFDFRDYYNKGDIGYYIRVNDLIGEKELIEVRVRTVYARTMVTYEENAGCHVINYPIKDRFYLNKKEAQDVYKKTKIAAKYSG